jgi:hypothetical protein
MPVSGPGPCAQVRVELGVYVLGAIAPADRAAVDRHLVSCRECREELAGFGGLPALLRRLPVAQQLADSSPSGAAPVPVKPLDELLRRVSAVRRRQRLATAAAVLAIAAAAAGVPQLLHPSARPHPAAARWWTEAADGSDQTTGVAATVRYAAEPWGTQLAARVTGIQPGTVCQFWVITADGKHAAAGGWTVAGADPHAWHPASVPFAAASLDSLDITAHGTVLVIISLRPSPRTGPGDGPY